MKSAVTDAAGTLTISAPRKKLAVHLELVDPEGTTIPAGAPYENRQAKLGRWTIVARAAGYEALRQTVDISPGDNAVITLDLKKLGGLSVLGAPVGAAVSVTGPDGFHEEGRLPWKAQGLPSGLYELKVSRTGYIDYDEVAEVRSEDTATLHVSLEKGTARPHEDPIVRGPFAMTSETVFDSRTNLTWQRAVPAKAVAFAGAQAYCRNLKLAGTTGWRLPTRAEMESLVDRHLSAPTIDHEAFPETPAEFFWSSTEYGGSGVWVIDFRGDNSVADYSDSRATNRVRCTR
jgi:hypothetical protein